MLSRLVLASIIAVGAYTPATSQDRMAPNAQFFSGTNFTGRSLTVTSSTPVFAATWTPRSVRMGGGSSWEVCEQPAFRGRCTVIQGSSGDLRAQLGVSGVRSVRQARTAVPPPVSGAGQSLKGMAAEFFPAPQSHGRRVEACPGGNASAACITENANRFCTSIGYVGSRNSAGETVGGRVFLADVLCSRWH